MIERHLAQAERHVKQGTVIVEKQRALVAKLQHKHLDSKLARKFLADFEKARRMYIEDRDRLAQTLATL